ncbi:putative ankyrin repeat protein RF_0381 isoform X1 [Mya arenaria]|uniref:putative ankyrin repeat protein RF_0381 isoform X1 n=1 Tax=Mya arenaria TaxID=6604 RepID=UPI0022E52C83|nr:putative ankyrin repeat protein RF_0381 isoform X1 [Mya arenaria]
MAGQMWDLAATPIGQAISAGDVDKVNSLVKDGENILFKDRKGNTYLHYVCTMYQPRVFYALVAHDIDVNAQNRHGNTALHVTALQRDGSCHVSDLMTCGIDPAIKNKDGKTADMLGTQNRYWHMIFQKYKKLFGPNFTSGPGIWQAVIDHDIPKIKQLLRSWIRVDCRYQKQTLRQFAACQKHHDIVVIIDEHRATTDMIYGVFEGNHEKVRQALKKTRCRVNFLNEISVKKHILQYAIKFKDYKFVKMLCDAGADINASGADVNTSVRVNNYFWGPLYFEVLHKDIPHDIMWHVLKSGADFTLKDERGRTGFMYALDKVNGDMPLEVFQYMLSKGADITERDCTGCNPRDIARFARRRDVVELIDKFYVKIIRDSDCDSLTQMAVDGYDSLMITHNYRDTFIYASGNKTDDVLQFIQWLPRFQDEVAQLHKAIQTCSVEEVQRILDYSPSPDLIVCYRNKARRTPLIQAVIYGRQDVVDLLIYLPYEVNIDAQDCCNRTAYHFACCLTGELGQRIRDDLIEAGADTSIKDVRGQTGEEFAQRESGEHVIERERQAIYGLAKELVCVDKYEELRTLIRAKRKGLPEFKDFLRTYRFPVVALHKVLSPLMPTYRDLIFLATDYGKLDIAYFLANIGADLCRHEKYDKEDAEGKTESKYYTPAERAAHLGFHDLAECLQDKQRRQLDKLRSHTPLLPKRAIKKHFAVDPQEYQRPKSCVFVTQSVV